MDSWPAAFNASLISMQAILKTTLNTDTDFLAVCKAKLLTCHEILSITQVINRSLSKTKNNKMQSNKMLTKHLQEYRKKQCQYLDSRAFSIP